jgi:hypothetical protein
VSGRRRGSSNALASACSIPEEGLANGGNDIDSVVLTG